MPKANPAEFRHCAVGLVRAGRKVPVVADELQISDAVLRRWVRQDRIDRGGIPGIATAKSAELRKARKRIRELEQELEILKIASKFLGQEAPYPKGLTGAAEERRTEPHPRPPADIATSACTQSSSDHS